MPLPRPKPPTDKPKDPPVTTDGTNEQASADKIQTVESKEQTKKETKKD